MEIKIHFNPKTNSILRNVIDRQKYFNNIFIAEYSFMHDGKVWTMAANLGVKSRIATTISKKLSSSYLEF